MAGANKKRPGRTGKKPEQPQKDHESVKQRSKVKSEIDQSKASRKARNKARIEARKAAGREKAKIAADKNRDRKRLMELRLRLGTPGAYPDTEQGRNDQRYDRSVADDLGKRLKRPSHPIPAHRANREVQTPSEKTEVAVNKPMTAVELVFRRKAEEKGIEARSSGGLAVGLGITRD